MGGLIKFDEAYGTYQIDPSTTKGISIDLSQIPDLGTDFNDISRIK